MFKPFYSDNNAPAAPKILEALSTINTEHKPSYGRDESMEELQKAFSKFFETEVFVRPIVTGVAANQISIKTFLPNGGLLFCHKEAHVKHHEKEIHEAINPQCKYILLEGDHGKIDIKAFQESLEKQSFDNAMLSITQVTEKGTVYSIEELQELCSLAKKYGLFIHIDGARFAYSVLHNNCDPAAMTSKLGVDILSFGASKLGVIGSEAIVLFDQSKAEFLEELLESYGHIPSKMRFLSIQLLTFLKDDHWKELSSHAMKMAQYFKKQLEAFPDIAIAHPVDSNHIFLECAPSVIAKLEKQGYQFYQYDENKNIYRCVTSFYTNKQNIDEFISILK